MGKYTIGIDFGSLSGRAVLVDVKNGEEIFTSTYDYPHKVMSKELPDGTVLGNDWALQHPQDYLDVFNITIHDILKNVSPCDIIGIGIDFTACTVLPVKADGTPLCFLDKYKSEPHAYVKLWKHHAAQDKANRINELAEKRGEKWLYRYGGKISSEWVFPKLLQIAEEAPDVYNDMDFFVEAADWVIWQLTGNFVRNNCTAGYKAIWSKKDGFPSNDFFKELSPKLENVIETKMSGEIVSIGKRAGFITEKAAELTGLNKGTSVAVANVDAHVTVPAVKINTVGKILAIMGTSTCHILLGDSEKVVPGMCGVVEDGVVEGFYGYEAGQSCVGDHFAWFVSNCVPQEYFEAAKKQNMDIHQYLTMKMDKYKVGETGLVALDWWNGNRSVLVDVDLTGLILGMTLHTKPEEIYRALVEATAFGTRKIIETFNESGIPINEFYAAGGIAEKNSVAMQIYSDILNLPVKISGSSQGPALGSAIFAAVAAGSENGGYDNISEASDVMGKLKDVIYTPIEENVKVYDKIYREYCVLHDFFGKENDLMKRMKKIKNDVSEI